ncbi:MAG: hypothetical protein JWQ71_3970 [Pedosphaera sp.]|nr:hypothetical protein [Pedosphaera sp.]
MTFKKTICSSLVAIGLIAQSAFAFVSVDVQPPSQAVFAGSNAVFTAQVVTTGGETITGYQWLMSTNNQNPFTTIAGATTAICTLVNVQPADAGYYFVKVTYQVGTNAPAVAVSSSVTLTVQDRARITGQPQNLTRVTGTTASFTVTAAGSLPLSYQWRHNGTNLASGGRITGAGAATVSIGNVNIGDAGGYDVVVSNAFAVATSQVATLTVLVPPSISVQPQAATVIVGSNATFSVTAGGTAPLVYRWQRAGVTMTNGAHYSGVTTSTLTISGAVTNDAANYSVFISNVAGSLTSAAASLTVLEPPIITSPTNAAGQQGHIFNYTVTATGTAPITYGAEGLPDGLAIEPVSGIIYGVPALSGDFYVTLYATNAALTSTQQLVISLITDVPGITSALTVNGKQGQSFTYSITASNQPLTFSASQLPPGLNFNPTNGVISGFPVQSGSFPVTIGVANNYGSDSQTLTINIASSVPIITSALTATGTENVTNFLYTIRASNTPTSFGAVGLPLGLTLNTTNGVITGQPAYGGTYKVLISARNAWGTGTNTLTINVAYASLTGLAITDVSFLYSKPYLLDFTFSLRDDPDPLIGNAVIRTPDQLTVVCIEGDTNKQVGVPIGQETAFIVDRAITKKLFKTFLVLDYTYSMFATPGAIDAMQAAVENLINQQPGTAQFGVAEFSADYLPPAIVKDFTSDKVALTSAIEGIQTNNVQGNYAGTRFYDALAAALAKFGPPTNVNEQRFVIVMSDGHDDASVLTPTGTGSLADTIVNMATNKQVKLYCVGFGSNPNVNVLQQLATQTQGRYFPAATPSALTSQFAALFKDLNAQYLLRWATLQRGTAFQPMFQVSLGGFTASYNTNMGVTNVIDNTTTPPTTNTFNVSLLPDFKPSTWTGNVQVGSMYLGPNADTNASSVMLRAFYVPRYVRKIQVHYRPNYPCTPVLASSGTGSFLNGWSLTQTNDGTGGQWLTLLSPNPSNALTSFPYGIMGDLVNFQFQYQALPNGKAAFSQFDVDNSVYTNLPPGGQSFVMQNSTNFITIIPGVLPPHGTPVPWLIAHGFNGDPAVDELSDPNGDGMPVWQEYIAGLNPSDPNSKFMIRQYAPAAPGQPAQITFSTALGRTYRVETALSLDTWTVLQDGISGTGGNVTVLDSRNLSGVHEVYYRVVVFYQ